MKKEVIKKTPKQDAKKDAANKTKTVEVRKTTSKKVSAKKTEPPKKSIKAVTTPQTECRHCHELIAEGLPVCPLCLRNQKDMMGRNIIAILAFVLLLSIIANHFIVKYYADQLTEEEYKASCILMSYEDLVRNPRAYKGKDVKIIGRVISVEGVDSGKSNKMTVKVDINLFEGASAQIIVFDYVDKDYDKGLLENDIVAVYGRYDLLNGNTPHLKAKYVILGA